MPSYTDIIVEKLRPKIGEEMQKQSMLWSSGQLLVGVREEPKVIGFCCICATIQDIKYCDLCGHWMGDCCRGKLKDRAEAAIKTFFAIHDCQCAVLDAEEVTETPSGFQTTYNWPTPEYLPEPKPARRAKRVSKK